MYMHVFPCPFLHYLHLLCSVYWLHAAQASPHDLVFRDPFLCTHWNYIMCMNTVCDVYCIIIVATVLSIFNNADIYMDLKVQCSVSFMCCLFYIIEIESNQNGIKVGSHLIYVSYMHRLPSVVACVTLPLKRIQTFPSKVVLYGRQMTHTFM